jgi:glyoxylase-like metal-dependent hydrolase (beta-lactamase superfamily II)
MICLTERTSILGHMHLDHAGGLDQFLDRTDVEIWVHDKELRSAFWSVATGADVGVYLEHYMKASSVDIKAKKVLLTLSGS